MAMILPRRQSFGESFGTGLGSGIGTGLQALANMKMQQMQKQKQAQQFSPIFQSKGFSPEESMALALSPPQVQVEALKGARLRGAFPEEIPQTQTFPERMDQIDEGFRPERREIPEQQVPIRQKYTPEQKSILEDAKRMSQATGDPRIYQKAQLEVAKTGKREEQFEKKLAWEKEKEAAKEKREMTKEERIKQHEINQETKPIVEKINKDAKAARDNNMRLQRMEKLNEEGNLGFPLFNSLVGTISEGIWGFGLDLGFAMTADAQEFNKLSTDFLKNVKDIFGARVTDREVKNYLKTVPTLAQSQEGRRRLINNLQMFNQASTIRQEAMDDIIDTNKGLRPASLESKVEKKIGSLLDELANNFSIQPIHQPKEEASVLQKLGRGVGISY